MPTKPKTFRPAGATTLKQTRKAADRRRGTSHSRGYDERWRRYSAWFRSQPECVLCDCGCGQLAECVDHIDAVSGPDDPRFYDIENHAPLTNRHHAIKSNRFDGARGRLPDRSPAGLALLQAMRDRARVRAARIQDRELCAP